MTEFIPPAPKKIRYTAPHILQTDAWGELKSAFGWYALRAEVGPLNVQILFRKLPLGLTIAYIPKPPVSLFRKNVALGAEVDRVCKKNKAIFLKVEPDEWEVADQQYALDGWRIGDPIQPPRTIVIDLRGSDDEILGRMKQKTRYNIRLSGRKGVTVRAWDDIDAFYEMIQTTGGRDGFGVHTKEYYQQAYKLFVTSGSAELLVAEYEGKPLAAVMVFISGNRAWYMYGASNNEERNKMPTYLISGKRCAGRKSVVRNSTTFTACPIKTKNISKSISQARSVTKVCGVFIVSSAASAAKSNALRRRWIGFISLCFMRFIER